MIKRLHGLGFLLFLVACALWWPHASAQTTCVTRNTAALLALFSDNAGPASITPSNVRDVICSGQQTLAAGASKSTLTLVSSPFNFAAPSAGTLLISSGQVSLSRDNGSTYFVVSLMGAQGVPLLAGDLVTVMWFGAGAGSVPTGQFLPWGQ